VHIVLVNEHAVAGAVVVETVTPTWPLKSVNARLAEELAVREVPVAANVRSLDEGSTVPFIARVP
jgi:hypothetical protein